MLVLTRNQGQSILIGDDIKLTVVSSRGGQVRFGIEAPPELTILREEVAKRETRAEPTS
jgi:carbon storage regulator